MSRPYFGPEDMRAWPPDGPCGGRDAAIGRTRQRMVASGQWHAAQLLGRHRPIGCVALEITQRCNLDCTLCYLSESSQAVKDVPLAVLFRRIDRIAATYGPGTDVQLTGGDPTLRDRGELVAICRRAAERGLRPALFTNGIRASRDLLGALAAAGLVDVAFHVDTTQQRKGYAGEAALNAVRGAYIERARGLGIAVLFNTTVTAGNLHEIPAVARFLAEHADVVSTASFQPHAATGRGVEDGPSDAVTTDAVAAAIEAGLGSRVPWGAVQPGHERCTRYGVVLVAGGRAAPVVQRPGFAAEMLGEAAELTVDRRDRGRALREIAGWAVRRPRLWPRLGLWAAGRLWALRHGLLPGRLRIHNLSIFIHSFMDAGRLEADRLQACAFTVATDRGMVPMCLHNARRDAFVLAPVPVPVDEAVDEAAGEAGGDVFWDPATGRTGHSEAATGAVTLSRKTARGRARRAFR